MEASFSTFVGFYILGEGWGWGQIFYFFSLFATDLDIVTFFNIPEGKDEQILSNENLKLFDNKHLKSIFKLDGYFCVFGGPLSDWEVRHISYWYSLWSHRRDNLWKGFVQVDLDPPDRLDAFLDAVKWGSSSVTDKTSIQSPFRAGIELEDYQLEPVVRAIQMPRVNLLIADEVGLGQSIASLGSMNMTG